MTEQAEEEKARAKAGVGGDQAEDGERVLHFPNQPPRGDYPDIWQHHDIGVLIRATKDFLVHIDKNGHIDWETTPDYDRSVKGDARHNGAKEGAILNECAVLETSPCSGLSGETVTQFKRLLGEAMVNAFELDYTAAQRMVATARQFHQNRSQEISRKWYLVSSFKTVIPVILAASVLWLARGFWTELIGETAFWLLLAVCAGAIGALFSVITRSGHLGVDASAGEDLHELEARSRIAAGAFSGLVVGLAIMTEMILGALTKGGRMHLVIVLGALAAGAGERLASSIISKLNSTSAQTPGNREERKGKGK